jgi:hypothetical protein
VSQGRRCNAQICRYRRKKARLTGGLFVWLMLAAGFGLVFQNIPGLAFQRLADSFER